MAQKWLTLLRNIAGFLKSNGPVCGTVCGPEVARPLKALGQSIQGNNLVDVASNPPADSPLDSQLADRPLVQLQARGYDGQLDSGNARRTRPSLRPYAWLWLDHVEGERPAYLVPA